MPTVFRMSTATNIGPTPVDVLQIAEGVRATLVGCNLSNTTLYETVAVDVFVVDEESTAALFVKNVIIPPNTAVKLITGGEKLILPETAGLRISSSVDGSVDAVISYVEIS
jgi:hypothetical protein